MAQFSSRDGLADFFQLPLEVLSVIKVVFAPLQCSDSIIKGIVRSHCNRNRFGCRWRPHTGLLCDPAREDFAVVANRIGCDHRRNWRDVVGNLLDRIPERIFKRVVSLLVLGLGVFMFFRPGS
jgi:hypothetical protein